MVIYFTSRIPSASALDPKQTFRFGHIRTHARSESGALTIPRMKIRVDSVEYKCWHEVGHANVCLHLGGDVDFIEFLDGDARGHARSRCVVTPEIERSVACGGFAAEFYLLDKGYAERGRDDERDISQIVFHNATVDREAFWGGKLGRDEAFTKT